MTEPRYVNIDDLDTRLEPGDRVTFTMDATGPDPVVAVVQAPIDAGIPHGQRLAGYYVYRPDGTLSRRIKILKVERPVVLPAGVYALLVPVEDARWHTPFLLNSSGDWLNDSGNPVPEHRVVDALSQGEVRVAFPGFDIAPDEF